jgi:hypothetical protein
MSPAGVDAFRESGYRARGIERDEGQLPFAGISEKALPGHARGQANRKR